MKFNLPIAAKIIAGTLLCAVLSEFAATSHLNSAAARPADRAGRSGQIKVLELDQISRGYGHLKVRINDSMVRVDTNNHGRYLLALAPQWRILAVDQPHHTFTPADGSSTALLMQRAFMIEGGDLTKVRWSEVKRGIVGGCPAIKLAEQGKSYKGKENEIKRSRGYVNISDELKQEGFWVADKKVTAGAANCLATITGLPACAKIPLHFVHITAGNREAVTVLSTTGCRETVIDKSLTCMPTGYKQTRAEYDGQLEEFRSLAGADK